VSIKRRNVSNVDNTVKNVVTSLASLGDEKIVENINEKLSDARE